MLSCPNCGNTKLQRAGQRAGVPRYRCRPYPDKSKVCWHGAEPAGMIDTPTLGDNRLEVETLHQRIESGAIKRYVITSAQNATPVWPPFFEALKSYCDYRSAQLIVIPYRYKNPTSTWSSKAKGDDWWAPELAPYLFDQRIDLTEHLKLLADIKTQPTAARPLQGFETMTGGQSAIVGHPKLEFVTVPTPQQKLPKILVTTGAVTRKNYIPSKAGKKGEFHHTFGACLVEIEDDKFFIRQLNAIRNGSFCDVDREYHPKREPRPIRAAALDMGDMHVDFADPQAVAATFGPGGIVETLKPKFLVWHDVLDFYSRMWHHLQEVFTNFVKHHNSLTNVEREVDRCFAFVDTHSPSYARNVFVYSNHTDMLARWIKGTDPRTDPENCVFWAKTFTAMCEAATMTDTGASTLDPFEWWARKKLKSYRRSRFLKLDESMQIRGIEVGHHGHYGPGGARGSLRAFTKIGTKPIIGHSHVPGINEGAYQVGTTTRLKAEYVKGPNAWLNAHCVIYPNGKRSLLIIVNGAWRREQP